MRMARLLADALAHTIMRALERSACTITARFWSRRAIVRALVAAVSGDCVGNDGRCDTIMQRTYKQISLFQTQESAKHWPA